MTGRASGLETAPAARSGSAPSPGPARFPMSCRTTSDCPRTGLVRQGLMTDDIRVSVRVFTILVAGLMFAGSARADEAPPPSFFVCAGKSPGDACEGDFGAGACVASTCSRLDYSKGSPPETVSRDCLKCQPPTPPAQSVVTTPAPSPPATAPAPETRGACQIGPGVGAPFLVLLALAMVRRRRDH